MRYTQINFVWLSQDIKTQLNIIYFAELRQILLYAPILYKKEKDNLCEDAYQTTVSRGKKKDGKIFCFEGGKNKTKRKIFWLRYKNL